MHSPSRTALFRISVLCVCVVSLAACGQADPPKRPADMSTGGDTGAGGSAGSGGSGGGAGGTGAGGRDAAAGAGGSGQSGGTGGTAALPDAAADAKPIEPVDAGSSDLAPVTAARVLFFTNQTAFTHQSIGPAVTSLKNLLGKSGVQSDTTAAPAMLTVANLAKYSGVVLINTNGKPFGDPGTAQIEALVAFVRGGGGLAGFHAASSTDYGPTGPFAGLLGGDTNAMPGGFRNANCTPEGMHQSVAGLPRPFPVQNEEFYTFNNLNPANQVVLRCDPATGTEKLPIAWQREEGAGRVFFSGIGHQREIWLEGGVFVMKHAYPAVLWTIKRTE